METYNFKVNWNTTDWNKTYIREALINGRVVEYDMADSGRLREPKSYLTDYVLWVYIGAGVIYRVNGVRQNFSEASHFWKRIDLEDLGAVIGK